GSPRNQPAPDDVPAGQGLSGGRQPMRQRSHRWRSLPHAVAALALCGPGVRLVVALPRHADANLWRLIRDEAALDTRVWLVPDSNTT
ncbi:MAG: hypothetical protein ACK5QQ_11500, partial [Cyanobacteriota bacterium]